MPPKVFMPSQYKEPAKQLLRQGKTPEEVVKEIPLSLRSIYRYLKEIQDEKKGAETKPGGGAVKTVQGLPTPLASVTAKTPAPIIFRIGDQNIDLDPLDLLDAYRYCEDIKTMEPAIDDSFSLMVKIAAKRLWEFFSQRQAQRIGISIGQQEEEA